MSELPPPKSALLVTKGVDKKLPAGWSHYHLGSLMSFRNGLNYNRADAGESIKIVGVADFQKRSTLADTSDLAIIKVETTVRDTDLLQSGDLLFVRSNGNKALIGRCLYFPKITERLSFSGFTIRGRSDPKRLLAEFASYLVRAGHVTSQFHEMGSGTNISNLSQEILCNIKVNIPGLTEQKRIANILATWDEAITTSENLLANSRKQKKALMQQLLYCKNRLPGFHGEWKGHRIGDVLREEKRRVPWDDDQEYALISIRRRSGGAFHRETLMGQEILTKKLNAVAIGDFLISKMQVVHGAMAMVTPDLAHMYASDSYITLRSADEKRFDIDFFGWLSATPQMYRHAYRSSYGVHIEKMTFDLGMFMNERVNFPPTLSEQQAICEVLKTANQEILSLEHAINQLHDEKNALMQRILTGKLRVKFDHPVEEGHAA